MNPIRSNQKCLLAFLLLAVSACSHGLLPLHSEEKQVWQGSEVHLRNWLDYTETLESMNARELKLEADRLRKTSNEVRSWDDELRWSLTQAVQHARAHSYLRAYEQIQPFAAKNYLPPELRSWLKLYSQQLFGAAQLERELGDERRLRGDLEKKLKALSELELELSQKGRAPR